MADAPSNPALSAALMGVLGASGDELRSQLLALLDALIASKLIAADDDGYVTVEGEEGASMLALFTDLIELHFFEPGSAWVLISGEDAIRRVAQGDFDGL